MFLLFTPPSLYLHKLENPSRWTKARWQDEYAKLMRELNFVYSKYTRIFDENEVLRNEVTRLLEKEWEEIDKE